LSDPVFADESREISERGEKSGIDFDKNVISKESREAPPMRVRKLIEKALMRRWTAAKGAFRILCGDSPYESRRYFMLGMPYNLEQEGDN